MCVVTRSLGARIAVVFTGVKVCAPECGFGTYQKLTHSTPDTLSGMHTSAYSPTGFDRSQISITLLGLIQLARGRATTSFTTSVFEGTSTSPSAYALALYSGLWAFDGWDQANYVGGEMSEPEKNIPRVIHSSMITVTVRPPSKPRR